MARKRTAKKTIRLGCYECNQEAYDGITADELRKLRSKAGGWKEVVRVQTYAQSIKTYDDPKDAPSGYSVLDWETHKGVCQDCVKERETKGNPQ
jgi:hypothetical protein